MKKGLLTVIFIIAACTTHAQVCIGGSVNAQLSKDSKTFSIAPDVGYSFPNTPFSVACTIEYEGSFLNGKGYSHTLTLSPYFRYSICDIEGRFSPFIDLTTNIDALKASFFNIGLTPGVSFNLTKHWSAEFSYGFLGYRWKRLPEQENEHRFELDFKAATAEFGIYYNF
jgi:opacity protein-like surface antigen